MTTFTEYGRYPKTRLRRNRADDWSRALVAENWLTPHDLILPVFVQEGEQSKSPIDTLPDIERITIDHLINLAKDAEAHGIPAIAIFPVVPENKKTDNAKEAFNPDNLICRAVRAVKNATSNIGVICDVALDPYTSHGHDGIVQHGRVVNDPTVEFLCLQALTQAKAGCDIIAPSDMMDGRIGAIRKVLDSEGFQHVRIISYAAKYASHFYGPFRDAVGSGAALGKSAKRTYQMDPSNGKEALREVALDIAEGADMVMVKPGQPYLDIVKAVSDAFAVPVFAYQVSGEYAMLKAAAKQGMFDYSDALTESLIGFKRAGATGIFTYAAMDIARKYD